MSATMVTAVTAMVGGIHSGVQTFTRDAATTSSEILGSIDRLHATGKKVSCKNCCMIERKTEPYESLDDMSPIRK